MATWWQQAAAAMERGDVDAAVAEVRAASEADELWRVSVFAMPQLQPLVDHPETAPLVAEARRRVEALRLEPQLLVEEPQQPGVRPLLLHLHGARGSAAAEIGRWRPARELGWIVAAGQSSQPSSSGSYCWDPPAERVRQDLRAIAGRLPRHGRLVLTGFSQGAWVALLEALQGDLLPASGAILVGPFLGRLDRLPPAARRLRVAIVIGGDDPVTVQPESVIDGLRGGGHHVHVETVPGLGHDYPADFETRLQRLLAAVTRSA